MRIYSGKYNHVYYDDKAGNYSYQVNGGPAPCKGKGFSSEEEAASDMLDYTRDKLGAKQAVAFKNYDFKKETN